MGNIKIEFIYSGKELSEEMIEGRKKKTRKNRWMNERTNQRITNITNGRKNRR